MAAEPRRAGVIGHPIAHSRSPAMHAAAYAELGMDWEYVAVDVPPAGLAEFVAGIEAAGFAGVNVTIPHKLAVMPMCAEIAPEARAAGSVNTLLVRDGAVHGHSTDGARSPVGARGHAAGRRPRAGRGRRGAGCGRRAPRRGLARCGERPPARGRRRARRRGRPVAARSNGIARRERHPPRPA